MATAKMTIKEYDEALCEMDRLARQLARVIVPAVFAMKRHGWSESDAVEDITDFIRQAWTRLPEKPTPQDEEKK